MIEILECEDVYIVKRIANDLDEFALLSTMQHNHVTQSSTKVDADHSNDVHLSNDVFYLNRSTISSTEVSFLYFTFKTVTHLSIYF